ncbi:alanyl-tRNA editing protein, partial [Klebsiella pneumoniae]|nr:alanyl-tRNA editing protein [Klebsiella pneumoniae]
RVAYTRAATDGRAPRLAGPAAAEGRAALDVARTRFHPPGGGHPAERGWIAGLVFETVVVRCARVLDILSQPLPLGVVEMKID